MTLIGYMRVSTKKQDTALQEDALLAVGVLPENLYRDVISGKTTTREGLDACMARLAPGDTLIVWRLDRLGRSLKHLVEMVEGFMTRGVGFRSIMDPVDTTSASGELVFHIFAAMAQFERRLAQERISAGIKSVMDAGRPRWGRGPAVDYKIEDVLRLDQEGKTIRQIARDVGISKTTIARVIKKYGERDV